MKRHLFAILTVLSFCLAAGAATATDTDPVTTDLNALVTKIKGRLKEGVKTEAQLAPEIKEFDALLNKYKSEKTDAVASILESKAMLYFQIFDDTTTPIACFTRIKLEFPQTKVAAKADETIAYFKEQEKSKAILKTLQEGKPFPDFQEKDIDGRPISVSKYKGKILLVETFGRLGAGPVWESCPTFLVPIRSTTPKASKSSASTWTVTRSASAAR